MAKSASVAKPAQTKNDEYSECRVVLEVLDRVGDKWTVLVVGVLANGPTRFNAIMRSITGISHRMLTLTLRNLERDGLIKRTAYATRPPKVEYELNELGRSLIEPLNVLATWAMQNRPVIEAARARFDKSHDSTAIE
jgi:DNA-binding HxlR family transcriptional regulator